MHESNLNSSLIPIEKASPKDAPKIGNKALALSSMINHGIPVPPGIIITTSAFENSSDFKTNPELIRELRQALSDQNIQNLAVRSSSVSKSGNSGEDSQEHSWAGIFETVLNVAPENIAEAIETVWNSARSESASSYAKSAGISIEDISMAVIVQEMIDADSAGVADSSINESTQIGIIEAAQGLGEAVVSGEVTPDQYFIDRHSDSLSVRVINTQTKARLGTDLTEINPVVTQKISDGQISRIWKTLKDLEVVYGYPIDMEWAVKNGELFVTQSRPLLTSHFERLSNDDQFYGDLIESDKWVQRVVRPWNLFTTSMTSRAGMTLTAKELELYIGETVNIESPDGGKVNHLWGKDTYTNIFNRLAHISESDPHTLTFILEQAKKYLNEAEFVLFQDHDRYPSLEESVKFTNDAAFYGTIIPFALLEAVEEGKNSELDAVCDEIRRKSFHAQLTATVVRTKAIERLKSMGVNDAEAVDLLTIDEILNENVGALEYRKRAHAKGNRFVYQNLNGQELTFFTNQTGDILNDMLSDQSTSARTNRFKGITAFPGFGEGPAYKALFYGNNDSDQPSDKVLITLNGHPSLRPLMEKSTAIISEEGGRTAHIARLAKEIQVPCVMGVKRITDLVDDGDYVRVDATNGIIELLDDKS